MRNSADIVKLKNSERRRSKLGLFFSPEMFTSSFHLLNVVNAQDQAVGLVAALFAEKKVYVYGILEKEGVEEDFKELALHYIKGLAKTAPDAEVYSCVYSGCRKIDFQDEAE